MYIVRSFAKEASKTILGDYGFLAKYLIYDIWGLVINQASHLRCQWFACRCVNDMNFSKLDGKFVLLHFQTCSYAVDWLW